MVAVGAAHPMPEPPFAITPLPTLVVSTIRQFLKDTVRPWESVSLRGGSGVAVDSACAVWSDGVVGSGGTEAGGRLGHQAFKSTAQLLQGPPAACYPPSTVLVPSSALPQQ